MCSRHHPVSEVLQQTAGTLLVACVMLRACKKQASAISDRTTCPSPPPSLHHAHSPTPTPCECEPLSQSYTNITTLLFSQIDYYRDCSVFSPIDLSLSCPVCVQAWLICLLLSSRVYETHLHKW